MIVEAAVSLIVVHMIDGRTIRINADQVTQLVEPREEKSQLPAAVNCVIGLTDGKFVSVAETCEMVRAAMEKGKL